MQNERLKELLKTMDVPESRKEDIFWLARNLFFRNRNNVNYEETKELIKQEIRMFNAK